MSVYRSEGVTIHVSSDEMSGLLTIGSKRRDFPSLAEIKTALINAGIKHGLNESLLERVCKTQDAVSEMIIAEGDPPFDGNAGELIWHVDIAQRDRPKINVDGKADFKQLNQFKTVQAGDEILSLSPGKPGKNGQTVTGKQIDPSHEVEPLTIPAGKNTRISEDGLILYADIDGVATIKNGDVVIDNVFHIYGDVDFSTGNVKYDGTVMIDGDVRSSFRVEATDSIYIHGSVEAADIYSKNGSVVIQNGVLGRDRARILAGDDLQCGFMQDATASVKNNVIIKHYAINSNITSGGKIKVADNEGLIRGGKTVAEKGIEILEAGSDRNILTEMVLSRSDIGEEQSKLWHIKINLAEEYQNLDSLKKRLEFLQLLEKRLGSISATRQKELSKLIGEISKAEQKVEEIRLEMEKLTQESEKQSPEQAVLIRDRLHPKVTVTIGHKKYFSTSIKGGVSIYRKGDELLVEPIG